MKNFKGKTAVVTGAASGIGYGLAEAFAKAGMQVVLADIEEQALDEAVQRLRDRQARVLGVVTNAMVEKSVQSLAERAIREFGKVHILCNNAGVTNPTSAALPIWELPKKDWDWVMGVNLNGVLYGIQAFVPHMLAHGEEGHIVNTASGAALLPGQGAYGISKHGVLCMTESLYIDLRTRKARIGASVLCPGFVNTNIVGAERNRPGELKGDAKPVASALLAMSKVMQNNGKQPDKIADEVIESIKRDSVYILPNAAWDEIFRARLEHILARGGPLMVDTADIFRRTVAGEAF